MTDLETQPHSKQAPRGKQALVLPLACAAMAMVGLDTAVVNVALPSIQRDLDVGPGTLQWVVVAYGPLLGGFLLVGGRMADQLGRRRVFLAGLGAFTAASLLAGVAPEAGLLIAARAAQGFGAALIVPAALSLLAVTFPEGPRRDRAFGIFGATGGAPPGLPPGSIAPAGTGPLQAASFAAAVLGDAEAVRFLAARVENEEPDEHRFDAFLLEIQQFQPQLRHRHPIRRPLRF